MLSFNHLWRQLRRLQLQLTYRLFQQKRDQSVTMERIGKYHFVVLPSVMNPTLFLTGKWFIEQLSADLIAPQSTVLDMGCGSGVVGVAAAQWARRVVSADVNPDAVRCASINRLLNHVEETVEVRQSNLFANLTDETFDVVLFNPPFFRGEPTKGFNQAWRANDVVERFSASLPTHLSPDGYALVLLSSNGDKAGFLQTFTQDGHGVETAVEEDIGSELLTIYRVKPKVTLSISS